MLMHVQQTVLSCFFTILRQLHSRSVMTPMIVSLIRLDYGIATLVGTSGILLNSLQSVWNADARFDHNARRHNHITSHVVIYIEYRGVLHFGCPCLSSGLNRRNLLPTLTKLRMWNCAAAFDLRCLRSALFLIQLIRRLVIEYFQLLLCKSGIHFDRL